VVLGASSGLNALGEIVDQHPDVVVLDLGLPDIDGLELLRMLRAVSSVPVIVATARDDEGDIVRTLDAGADEYVVKPYSAHQLDARIRAVLRRVRRTARSRRFRSVASHWTLAAEWRRSRGSPST